MKLLTHNMLTSKILKNVVNGYPLKINATKVEEKKSDFQHDFINRIIKKVDYKVLHEAATTVNYNYICLLSTMRKFLLLNPTHFVKLNNYYDVKNSKSGQEF